VAVLDPYAPAAEGPMKLSIGHRYLTRSHLKPSSRERSGYVSELQELAEHGRAQFWVVAVVRGMPAEADHESGTRQRGVASLGILEHETQDLRGTVTARQPSTAQHERDRIETVGGVAGSHAGPPQPSIAC
jgi:hypothetical protein